MYMNAFAVCVLFGLYVVSVNADSYTIPHSPKDCPNDPSIPHALSIEVVSPDFSESGQLDTRFTLKEIRSLVSGGIEASQNVVAFADVRYTIGYEYSTRSFVLPKNKKYACHYVDTLTFKVEFESPPTVLFPSELYEARDQDGGVCFDQIYAHEMQHIYDYEQVFEDTLVRIQNDGRLSPVNDIPTRNNMLKLETKHTRSAKGRPNVVPNALVAERVNRHYSAVVEKTTRELKSEISRRSRSLDSTHEYQRITEYCMAMIDYIK